MLSIAPLKDPGAVVAYFEKDNYYAKDDPHAKQHSQWFGRGAERLGLSGTIEKDDFTRLLEGYIEDTRLGRNVGGKWEHTPGWDLTFSAPKSYSILNQLSDDAALRSAHDDAVKDTLRFAEDHASLSRLTSDGRTEKVLCRNLIVSMFRHDTSRALDPNDHTHCVLSNAVLTEKGWRSLDSKTFFEMKLQLGEFYRRQLARRLIALGFKIDVTREKDFLFEINGVPKILIEHHSKRRKSILAQLDDLNLDSAKAAAVAALDTRQAKLDADRNELRREWRSIAQQYDFDPSDVLGAATKNKRRLAQMLRGIKPSLRALEVVEHSIAVLSERDAAFDSTKLIKECISSPIYSPSYDEVLTAIGSKVKSGDLIEIGDHRRDLYTTKAGQALEKATIDQLHQNFEKFSPIRENIDLKELFPDIVFSKGQGDSLELILGTKDQFVGVQGYAGTGKTFMLRSATAIAEMAGYEVVGMAPSSSAAQVLSDEIDRPTQNLSQHIASHYRQKREYGGAKIDNSKQLWFVDESSLACTKDLKNVMDIAVETNARVVFIGDIAQKDSVEAGRIFFQLQAAGMDTATMADIKRQRDDDLKKAVYSLVSLISVNELKEIDHNVSKDFTAARRDFSEFCDNVKPLVPDQIHQELLNISCQLASAQTTRERNDCMKRALSVMSDDVTKALERLDGRIYEYADSRQRESALIEDFFQMSPVDRNETILIVPSNDGRERVNLKLRRRFAGEGTLHGAETKINALVNRGLESQRLKHSYSYRVGDVIRFGRNFRKNKEIYIEAGEYLKVVNNNGDGRLQLRRLCASRHRDAVVTWKPQKTMRDGSVELYEEKERCLQVGERIRWRKNITQLGIMNGAESTITAIQDSYIDTVDAKGVARSFDLSQIGARHLDYAYTHTVDSAQGATYKRVLGLCESYRTNLINQKALYVVISRAEDHAQLYTDKSKRLLEAIIDRHGANTVAIDAKAYARSIDKQLNTVHQKLPGQHLSSDSSLGLLL